MVTTGIDNALNEGSSLRVAAVSKSFPAPQNPAIRTHALDNVSISIGAAYGGGSSIVAGTGRNCEARMRARRACPIMEHDGESIETISVFRKLARNSHAYRPIGIARVDFEACRAPMPARPLAKSAHNP